MIGVGGIEHGRAMGIMVGEEVVVNLCFRGIDKVRFWCVNICNMCVFERQVSRLLGGVPDYYGFDRLRNEKTTNISEGKWSIC